MVASVFMVVVPVQSVLYNAAAEVRCVGMMRRCGDQLRYAGRERNETARGNKP